MFFSYLLVFFLGWFASTITHYENNLSSPQLANNDVSLDQPVINNTPQDDSYIDSLHKMISDYQNKLSILEDDNKSLISDLLDSEGKLSLMATKPTILKKINNMSDEDVYEKIGEVVRESYLENVDNPKAFASRLTDIALTDEDEESVSSDGTANSEVQISISQFPGYQEMSSNQVVVSQYRRLYVNMISSLPVPNGLIKWKNLSEDKVLMFRGLSFQSRNDSQFVWGLPKDSNGWKPGQYQVSVYQINNELTLLATKVYSVTEVIDEGPEPVPDIPVVDGPPIKMQRQ